jgi:hypothetical protein
VSAPRYELVWVRYAAEQFVHLPPAVQTLVEHAITELGIDPFARPSYDPPTGRDTLDFARGDTFGFILYLASAEHSRVVLLRIITLPG